MMFYDSAVVIAWSGLELFQCLFYIWELLWIYSYSIADNQVLQLAYFLKIGQNNDMLTYNADLFSSIYYYMH